MALEHIVGVLALAFINEKYIREHFQERFSKMMLDAASFIIVFFGVMIDFIGITDYIWFSIMIGILELVLLGIALIVEQIMIGKKVIELGFFGRKKIPPLKV